MPNQKLQKTDLQYLKKCIEKNNKTFLDNPQNINLTEITQFVGADAGNVVGQ